MAVIRGDGTEAEVTDLYEATYLFMKGQRLAGIECFPLAGSLACRILFADVDGTLGAALGEYVDKSAVVNLYAFRAAYNQLNSLVHQAKKRHAEHARTPGSGGAV
jgi:hypothetical protein